MKYQIHVQSWWVLKIVSATFSMLLLAGLTKLSTAIHCLDVCGYVLGINVFVLLFCRHLIFSGFYDCHLKFACVILFRSLINPLNICAFWNPKKFQFLRLSHVLFYALCSGNAVRSFCAFERELPLDAVGIAGDICISRWQLKPALEPEKKWQ